MSRVNDWADDDEDLPPTQSTTNKDGTVTIVSYSLDPATNRKVKRTQRVRRIVAQEIVHPRVAERAKWAKFGDEEGSPPGPQPSSTATADNIAFHLALPKKIADKDTAATEQTVSLSVRCRICSSNHWTTKCPFKDSMMPESEKVDGDDDGDEDNKTGAYVPVNRRSGAAPEAASKYERDDSTTLRVTNLNDSVEEQELRELFNKGASDKDGRPLGRVVRVFLARDKHTNRLKGFAFINFDTRTAARAACEKLDGHGFHHLILKVDFPKQPPP